VSGDEDVIRTEPVGSSAREPLPGPPAVGGDPDETQTISAASVLNALREHTHDHGPMVMLKFPLPEDRRRAMRALLADQLAYVLWELDERLHRALKHGLRPEGMRVEDYEDGRFVTRMYEGKLEDGEGRAFEAVRSIIRELLRDDVGMSLGDLIE